MGKYEDDIAEYESDLSYAEEVFFHARSHIKKSKNNLALFQAVFRLSRESIIQKNIYSQGVAFDGAAILKDGEPMTIDEIIKELNK